MGLKFGIYPPLLLPFSEKVSCESPNWKHIKLTWKEIWSSSLILFLPISSLRNYLYIRNMAVKSFVLSFEFEIAVVTIVIVCQRLILALQLINDVWWSEERHPIDRETERRGEKIPLLMQAPRASNPLTTWHPIGLTLVGQRVWKRRKCDDGNVTLWQTAALSVGMLSVSCASVDMSDNCGALNGTCASPGAFRN